MGVEVVEKWSLRRYSAQIGAWIRWAVAVKRWFSPQSVHSGWPWKLLRISTAWHNSASTHQQHSTHKLRWYGPPAAAPAAAGSPDDSPDTAAPKHQPGGGATAVWPLHPHPHPAAVQCAADRPLQRPRAGAPGQRPHSPLPGTGSRPTRTCATFTSPAACRVQPVHGHAAPAAGALQQPALHWPLLCQ